MIIVDELSRSAKGGDVDIIDTFTGANFAGNTAAVVRVDELPPSQWAQAVATEFGYNATAFLTVKADFGGVLNQRQYKLCWFSASAPLPICGHGTLAAAFALWDRGEVGADEEVCFDTPAGQLIATTSNAGDITLRLPAYRGKLIPQATDVLERLLPDSHEAVINAYRTDLDLLLELVSPRDVESARPDMTILLSLDDIRGLILTSASDHPDFDIVSRFFTPATGIDEDSVTGSAHCALAPYWAPRFNSSRIRAFQASRRGGFLSIEDHGTEVHITGAAKRFLHGHIATDLLTH